MKEPTTIVMELEETCQLTFELSPLKRLLAWILNDPKPNQPLTIIITTENNDGNKSIVITVDNNHFKGFEIGNINLKGGS